MLGGCKRGFSRDDELGSRPEQRGLERVCQVLALLVSSGFALAAFWELADTFSAGHYASASAVCTSGENMWRWGILAPVPHHTLRPPLPSEYYCHHPWGIFWVTALFMKAFGHHAWACRLPAAIQSALTPPALYLAGRALWGPVAGVVAAASFAAVPIALSFSDMNALEVPVIFGTVVAVWGYARFRASYLRRFLSLGLGGLVYAVCCDWAAVIFAAVMLAAIFLSVFLLTRFTLVADRRRIASFWGLGVALCALAVGAHLDAFQHFGQLNELLSQGNLRSTGSDLPLRQVLVARKFWIEVSFTGLAIGLGKFALPVLGLRTLVRRSELEALPLAVFAMATVQYVAFKQGADIHVFWPHYFAEYFAFACAGLIQSALDVARCVTQTLGKSTAILPSYLGLGLGLLVPLAILPDGLRALHYGHRSGGRFNENGHPTKPDKDKVAVLEWLSARMAANTGVVLHPGMRQSLWVDWSMRRPAATVNRAPTTAAAGQDRYYVADMRFMTANEQEALADNFSVTALGSFLTVDRAEPKGQFRAFAVQRYEPSLLQAYWVSSSHALRRVVPSPFITWELRDRFELNPNDPPTTEPTTFEEMRIMHNVAVARGDKASEKRWLDALLAGGDQSSRRAFADGDELLGSRLERGASFVYSVYFLAAGPDASEPELEMHSVVEAAPHGSLVAKDDTVAEVGMPFAIPASRWKRGYVYASVTEVIRRIGRERWYGTFRLAREAGAHGSSPPFELLRID
jgi:Dolichyl-phosphate-mannose-protein mannosyltransferase